VLIIAYGNPLRSDDGVAWHAAEQLRGKFPPEEVETQTLHQLGPELAESISRSALTIFIDAASAGESGEVRVEQLEADASSSNAPYFYHSLSPGAVLAIAKQLYGAEPHAFSVTVTGESFEHGERLSPLVQAAVPKVVRRIEELVHACQRKA
jgi:hydrogenase maturation protease